MFLEGKNYPEVFPEHVSSLLLCPQLIAPGTIYKPIICAAAPSQGVSGVEGTKIWGQNDIGLTLGSALSHLCAHRQIIYFF